MQIIQQINKFLKTLFPKKEFKPEITMNDIIDQLSNPPLKKEKTKEEIQKHYLIQEALFQLEIDMLKMGPAIKFKGVQRWKDVEGNVFFDWVPCVVRPEVILVGGGRS